MRSLPLACVQPLRAGANATGLLARRSMRLSTNFPSIRIDLSTGRPHEAVSTGRSVAVRTRPGAETGPGGVRGSPRGRIDRRHKAGVAREDEPAADHRRL